MPSADSLSVGPDIRCFIGNTAAVAMGKVLCSSTGAWLRRLLVTPCSHPLVCAHLPSVVIVTGSCCLLSVIGPPR
uniref:Uncharacterized protein n=1 Tax=Paramormyrops kingsleyae TaxID=1676925 RepID=A0A3B3RJE2_9TELE